MSEYLKHLMYITALALSVVVAACATQYQSRGVAGGDADAATAMQRGDAAYKRQDYATALHEWQFLARQGNPVAQYKLGSMYEQGLGVARDLAEAHRLFAKAAENSPPGRERDMAVQARAQVERLLATNQAITSPSTSATPPTPISASPQPPLITLTISAPSRTMEAQQTAMAPFAQSLDGENISLAKKGGVYQLPVEINGVITLHFVLDTGAADVNIPADVALTLHRTGTIHDTDFLPGKTYTLADGSKLNSARFLIRSLKIGNYRVTNVAASVGPISSTLLLGQSFLEKLGTYGIDNQRQVLTLGTKGQRKESTPHQTPSSLPGGPQVEGGSYPRPAVTQPPLRKTIDMEFVLIQAGTFQMGSNDSNAYTDEKPVHTVRITQPFYLSKYEVTQGQWETVMGTNPSKFTGDPSRPVENVSWDDVQEFIRRLNVQEGKTTYRLPTEAEWEYAAHAGTTTRWSFGDDVSQLGRYAWYDMNAGRQTHLVGQLLPNPWGLYDMYGNVLEWVQDGYESYASGTAVDPTRPSLGSYRVNRGGGWSLGAHYCRASFRAFTVPGGRINNLGFRLLRVTP